MLMKTRGGKQTVKDTVAMARQLIDPTLMRMVLPKVEQMANQSGIDLSAHAENDFTVATAMVAVALEMALPNFMPQTEKSREMYQALRRKYNPDAK